MPSNAGATPAFCDARVLPSVPVVIHPGWVSPAGGQRGQRELTQYQSLTE